MHSVVKCIYNLYKSKHIFRRLIQCTFFQLPFLSALGEWGMKEEAEAIEKANKKRFSATHQNYLRKATYFFPLSTSPAFFCLWRAYELCIFEDQRVVHLTNAKKKAFFLATGWKGKAFVREKRVPTQHDPKMKGWEREKSITFSHTHRQ